MRNTRQRRAILRLLETTSQHPTASWIFDEVRKELPRIGLGTVYRLLESLVNEGLVQRIQIENGPSRYERTHEPHAHIHCQQCGQLADAPMPTIPEVWEQVAQATGYTISQLQLEWYGLCPACQAVRASS